MNEVAKPPPERQGVAVVIGSETLEKALTTFDNVSTRYFDEKREERAHTATQGREQRTHALRVLILMVVVGLLSGGGLVLSGHTDAGTHLLTLTLGGVLGYFGGQGLSR